MKHSLRVVVILGSFLALPSIAAEEGFKPLSAEHLTKNLENVCMFKLAAWFGEAPPQELDLSGKRTVVRKTPPIFSKEFDKKYYEIMDMRKALAKAKSYEASKKSNAKLSDDFEALVKGTEFFKTCQKIAKKVASECLKSQESKEELQKCAAFYQDKFDILDQHNNHIMDIPELKKKAAAAAKWLEE